MCLMKSEKFVSLEGVKCLWIKKYNRKDLMNTRVKVETKGEISRIKGLQK